jgi:hypothetical protein
MIYRSHALFSRLPASPKSFAAALLLAVPVAAQVPDGWIVWGSFMGVNMTLGENGIWFSHPRDGLVPSIRVTGLPPALGYDPAGRRGSACISYRSSDGMLIAGERAPAGTSVDLHVMRLQGSAVVFDQLFSVGTSASVGEIPQAALLPDGRIVVAATDLRPGGPLSQFQTLQYNWEGVGIVDTISGSVTPIAISNLSAFPGVINGLAVTPDGQDVYITNYISGTLGDLWRVPITGGTATLVATVTAGASNVAIDNDGTVLVTTLAGPPNLFRYNPGNGTVTPITTVSGPLNAVAVERVSGEYALATANAGLPSRSLIRMDAAGVETVLLTPNQQTISGVDFNPNPEAYGASTPGAVDYFWKLAPNPGGLPLLGNAGFSLTLAGTASTIANAITAISFERTAPTPLFGLTSHVDLALAAVQFTVMVNEMTVPLPLPNNPAFLGVALFVQTFLSELPTELLAASPGVSLTLM